MDCRVIALGFVILCLHFGPTSGTLLKSVTNVKWKSFNFRTTLQWEKTSENVVYTVRLTDKKSDWKKKPECTQMEATSCDLTSLMQNVNATYFAEVLSFDVTSTEENEQPPFTKSPEIQLLKDTELGQASFKIVKNETEIQLTIEDPLTHIRFSNKTPKTLRDIYGPELEYKVFYWKDRTSGKKTKIVKGQVLLMDVDPGFGYCFSIQPYIRSPYKNGQESSFQCTHSSEGFLSDYGLSAYALVGLGVLLILSIFIGITVFLCRRKTVHNIPEANPLTV